MVKKSADTIANWIRKNNPNSSSFAVLRVGLIAVINLVVVVVIVLAITAITGDLITGIICSAILPILRHHSGGIHTKIPETCNIITAGFIIISIYTPLNYWYNGFALNIISVIILAIYAPSGIKQSRLKGSDFTRIKIISLAIVSSNFIFHSPVLALLFFIQSLTTIPVTQTVIDRLKL